MIHRILHRFFSTVPSEPIVNGIYRAAGGEIRGAQVINGMARIGNVELPTLIKEWITINGSLLCQNARFRGELTVNGEANLYQVEVEKAPTTLNGSCKIQSSRFFDLTCRTDRLILKDTTLAGSLKLLKIPFQGFFSHLPEVELKNTLITGDIHFEGGNGRVILDQTSFVGGDVIGGEKEEKGSK